MPPCCIFLFLCPLPPSPHPSDHRAAHILISVEWLPVSFSLLLGKGNKDITTFSSIVLEHLSPFLFPECSRIPPLNFFSAVSQLIINLFSGSESQVW